MRLIPIFIFVLSSLSLQACVYRMDIEQGNRVDADKLQQLEIGMTRSQVEFLLGKAAINDPYHANKSHYVFYLLEGETRQRKQETMVLTYENGVLVNIEGSLPQAESDM